MRGMDENITKPYIGVDRQVLLCSSGGCKGRQLISDDIIGLNKYEIKYLVEGKCDFKGPVIHEWLVLTTFRYHYMVGSNPMEAIILGQIFNCGSGLLLSKELPKKALFYDNSFYNLNESHY